MVAATALLHAPSLEEAGVDRVDVGGVALLGGAARLSATIGDKG